MVRIWNNFIEMFLEWPFSELFLKFWSVNKHGISEWRLLALYRHKEILVNSSLKTTRKKWLEQSQKFRWAIQGHLGPLVLAHLSTRRSGWAIVINQYPVSIRPCVHPSICEQLLKKSSPLNPANRFQWNFTEMILGWYTFRNLQRFEFHVEPWLPWQPKEKTLKILSQTIRARAFIFGMYHHLVALYQNTSNYSPGVETSPMLWVLDIEIKKEIFKNLLVQNR